jgi:hypothetical protein
MCAADHEAASACGKERFSTLFEWPKTLARPSGGCQPASSANIRQFSHKSSQATREFARHLQPFGFAGWSVDQDHSPEQTLV